MICNDIIKAGMEGKNSRKDKYDQGCTVHSYPISSPVAAKLREKLMKERKKFVEAL